MDAVDVKDRFVGFYRRQLVAIEVRNYVRRIPILLANRELASSATMRVASLGK